MKNFKYFILNLIFLLSSNCNKIDAQNFIVVNKNDFNKEIHLNTHDILQIELPVMPSNGYSWYISYMDTTLLQLLDIIDFKPESEISVSGAEGTKIFKIAGKENGTTKICLEYKRIWEKINSL